MVNNVREASHLKWEGVKFGTTSHNKKISIINYYFLKEIELALPNTEVKVLQMKIPSCFG